MSRRRITRARLLDDAFLTALRFNAGYRGYQNEAKALIALRRGAPGYSTAQYESAFAKGLKLCASTLRLIKRSLPSLRIRWKIPQQSSAPYNLRPLMLRLRRQEPGFLSSTYLRALNCLVRWPTNNSLKPLQGVPRPTPPAESALDEFHAILALVGRGCLRLDAPQARPPLRTEVGRTQ
jgi:hypothetical protein